MAWQKLFIFYNHIDKCKYNQASRVFKFFKHEKAVEKYLYIILYISLEIFYQKNIYIKYCSQGDVSYIGPKSHLKYLLIIFNGDEFAAVSKCCATVTLKSA